MFDVPMQLGVTERENFGRSPELLSVIANKVEVPVFRKDFIKDESILIETGKNGAAAVLLICEIIGEEKLELVYNKAKALNLESFVEACTPLEMNWQKSWEYKLIGINNRKIIAVCGNFWQED